MPISKTVFESTESEDIDTTIFNFLKQNYDKAFSNVEIANLLMLSKNPVKDERCLSNEVLFAIARLAGGNKIRGKLFAQVVYYSI